MSALSIIELFIHSESAPIVVVTKSPKKTRAFLRAASKAPVSKLDAFSETSMYSPFVAVVISVVFAGDLASFSDAL